MAITTKPVQQFTDEILKQNFSTIDRAFTALDIWSRDVDRQLTHVTKLASKKPSKVKPFILGAVVGIAVLRAAQNRSDQLKKAMDDTGLTETAAQVTDKAKDIAQSTAKDLRDKA